MAMLRAFASSPNAAYAGTCTRLKKYSIPIQVIPARMCSQRKVCSKPSREKNPTASTVGTSFFTVTFRLAFRLTKPLRVNVAPRQVAPSDAAP